MQLELAKIISSGDAIGWAENKTFFISGVLPGETIEFKDFYKEKSYYRPHNFRIIRQSPQRRKPICPLFGVCGGCSFLNMNYQFQAETKISIFKELILQQKLDIKEVLFRSEGEFNQRTRAKIIVTNRQPSFRKKMSHETITFENCPLIHPELNKIMTSACKNMKNGLNIQFEFSKNTGEWIPDRNFIEKEVLGKRIGLSKNSFFQASENGAALLSKLMLKKLDEISPAKFLDFFSGVGLFSKIIEDRNIEIMAVESAASSVSDYKKNLGKRGNILSSDGYKITADFFNKFKFMLIDPPRAGIGEKLSSEIISSSIENIVYISCNPSTFARDISYFINSGFKLSDVTICDLFPATPHFEVFSFLSR